MRLAWLEEEALAYVRRGRLERTAQCLPYATGSPVGVAASRDADGCDLIRVHSNLLVGVGARPAPTNYLFNIM